MFLLLKCHFRSNKQFSSYLLVHGKKIAHYNTLTKASKADNLQEVPALTECHFHSGGSTIPQLPA